MVLVRTTCVTMKQKLFFISLGASSILIWLFFMHSYNNKSFYICDDWKGWLEVNLGLRVFEKKFKLEHVVWIYFEYDLVEEE